ncbi:MAG: galactofuranose transport system substrate-binding protein [Acidobacteriota bacterium]|jgi:ribose transport system substrate-binding protein|nr:galactofuranose transport system substrate-binding protein [Acidobacteriota bacterium]
MNSLNNRRPILNNRRHAAYSILLAFALLALCLSGCRKQEGGTVGTNGTSSAPGGKKMRVGFSQTETDGPWRIAETKSMQDEAARRGYELVFTNARGDTATQVSNLEDLIAQRVDAIFLAPRESKGFDGPLQAAKQAGIPVFLIDRELEGPHAGDDYVTFIGSNFIEEGKRAGEWLAKQTSGKAGIVELLGTAGSSVANDRHQGFADAIKAYPDMKIITAQDGNFTRAQGQKVMESLIQAHGKSITAVYTHNDEMALGAIQALRSANMNPGKDVLVVSVDGQKSALEAIIKGDMNATVECNPRFGPVAFDTLEKFKRGDKIPPKIINEDRFFDKPNAEQHVGEAF